MIPQVDYSHALGIKGYTLIPMFMLVLIAIVFSLGTYVSALPVHGTLVIAVPTNEGLLIVSDRLRHSEERGYDDTTER